MLTLDDRNLLPAGVHDASEKEVQELFGRFQRSDRRPKLFGKLREFLKALRQADIAVSVIINGSFVMGCVDEPEDIDLIIVLPENWDWKAELKPFQYEILSKRWNKREFGFDVFVVSEGSQDEEKWRKFFSRVNVKWCDLFGLPPMSEKGLLRVKL